MPPDEPDSFVMMLECLRSPALRHSVTFQHFQRLVRVISEKRAAGHDISAETEELLALRPAIEAEMRLIEHGGKPS